MQRIYQFKKTATPSSGSVSFNTQDLRGIMRALIVSPATQTTKWNITFTNNESVIIYKSGTKLGDLVHHNPIPLYGIYTVAIAGASKDEAFKITINYVELQ